MARPFVPIIHAASADRPDELDTIESAECIRSVLTELGYDSAITVLGLDLSALHDLAAQRPVVIFNLVEAMRGDDRLAFLPCAVMDHLGVRYTGTRTDAHVQFLSKLTLKQVLRAHDIATPDWWRHGVGVPADQRVIVKSVGAHASLGMDADSIVDGKRARAEVSKREREFGGEFFAEAYIDGREFNVAVLRRGDGVRVLPIPEMLFDRLPAGQPRIIDYDAKWKTDSVGYIDITRGFGLESREHELAAQISEMTIACWHAFDLTGYARVDFRVGADGRPYVLEVNANPCLSRDAGFAAAAEMAGISYQQLIADIVTAAAAI